MCKSSESPGNIKIFKKVIVISLVLTFLLLGQQLYAFCGDADGSGSIDVSDAVYILTYIFFGGSPPDPIYDGDADNNGFLDISDVVYLVTYIFAGGPEPCPQPSGSLINYSACKDNHLKSDSITTFDGCIIYEYDGSQLLLTHVNAGFNCCPVMLADLFINGNDISIIEIDSPSLP